MVGDREATVREVQHLMLHGVTYYDVVVALDEGATLTARLGAEAVPEDIQPGDRVVATLAVNMLLGLRRL